MTTVNQVRAAIHEAGHAVVRILAWRADPLHAVTSNPIRYVNITRTEIRVGVMMAEQIYVPGVDLVDPWAMAWQTDVLLAGPLAESWYSDLKGLNVKLDGPGNDFDFADAAAIGDDAFVAASFARVQTLLVDHWASVVNVATALLAKEFLDGDEVEALMVT